MESINHRSPAGAPTLPARRNDDSTSMMTGLVAPDDMEADTLNDETFGDCDLDAIKIKSDFGENGEFLGDYPAQGLPDFFDADSSDTGGGGLSLMGDDDQSQQPSIDALLGEDPMRFQTASINLRSSTTNPLFSMAISQARETNHGNIFSQQAPAQVPRISPMTLPPQPPPLQPQINYQLLKQFEQMLISQQIPPQERAVYMRAMVEKLQRDALNTQQQQAARMMNMNANGHDRYRDANQNRMPNNPLLYAQRQQPQQQQQQQPPPQRPMAIGEMMERARLAAMNNNNMNTSRSQSPGVTNTGMSSQFMGAIQRSDQIPIIDAHQKQQQQQQQLQQNRANQSPSSPMDNIVSPSSSSHHSGQPRQNRPSKHYPRPPCLNTWQGRGPGHDEFAGMMSDREKQWVVKIQLHQVSQTKEEDYYFQKWSQQKRQLQQTNGTQLNRHDHRGQYITYPVLQLLKSIQQEKELAERLSQSSMQGAFSNVNPAHALPYASPLHTQLGKQSTATPRHPKCTLDLGGVFSIGTHPDAITHDKYTLGLLLNIENLHRDFLELDENDNVPAKPTDPTEPSSAGATPESVSAMVTASKKLLDSIVDRYFNHSTYLFADTFSQGGKGQTLLERLYPHFSSTTTESGNLELALVRLYGSLSYMVHRLPSTFRIEPIVMNTISLIQQHVTVKTAAFELLLAQAYTYYDETIKPKLLTFHPAASSSPFSDPALFTNSQTVTILIELLLTLERRCYLLPGANSSTLPIQIMQQLQPQLQYQLSERIRSLVTDLCQALVDCVPPTYTPRKMLKPFAQVQQQQFGLLLKFLRIQTSPTTYAALEPKLIFCCIKDP